MKVLKNIAFYGGISLMTLLSVVFAFIEFRSLIAGDFTLMNNQALAFVRYLFRGFFYLGLVAIACLLLCLYSSKIKVNFLIFVFALSMFVGGCFSFFFYDFYVALVPVCIATILAVIAGHSFFKKE